MGYGEGIVDGEARAKHWPSVPLFTRKHDDLIVKRNIPYDNLVRLSAFSTNRFKP